jgi:hypothetical protein
MTRKQTRSSLARILKRRYWRGADAEVVLSAYRDSGLSLSAFCRRHGMRRQRLMRWRGLVAKDRPIEFHPIQVISMSKPVGSGIELVLRTGHHVAVQQGFDPALLEELVRTVESWSC